MQTGIPRSGPRRAAILAVVTWVSWRASPMSILPTLVFLGITLKVCVDLIQQTKSRYIWILTLAFAFAGVGTIHDLMIESHASALRGDGTYSYSANRRGTCSWHHGVSEWNPRIPAWWERFSK